MSSSDNELPERLQLVGATELERRLLDAAGRERPSRELSARMAQAIGVSLPAGGTIGGGQAVRETASQTGATAPQAATASSSLLPWVAGAFAVAVVAGVFVADKLEPVAAAPGAAVLAKVMPAEPARVAAPVVAAPAVAVPAHLPPAAAAEPADREVLPSAPANLSIQRGRLGAVASATESDLREQIALVDSARAALANGGADRALTAVRDYQTRYPSGAFRPEAAAVKVEALVKLGRAAEARTAAERFVATYGPSLLAERVARLAGLAQP